MTEVTDEMITAGLDMEAEINNLPLDLTACACMGPLPHCKCSQSRMRAILNSALSAKEE